MSEIEAGLTRLESVVCTKRNNKIGNLLHKQKLHRKIRFRQLDKPEAELAVSNSTVINLSSATLSEAEEKLLSKGLNFCPTPTEVNQVEVNQNLTEYYRRLRLSEFFLPPTDPEPFRCKSTRVPPKNRVPSLETYIQLVSFKINSSDHSLHMIHDNLPREQREALKSLRSRKDIIIK